MLCNLLRINYKLSKLIPGTAETFRLCSYMLIAISSWIIVAVNLKQLSPRNGQQYIDLSAQQLHAPFR